MVRESWGIRTRRQVAHAAIYSLLVAVTAIMLFPVAWMLTVSVRPNVEVMKIPPQWIPTVFTWEPYLKVLSSPRYMWTFVNSYFIAGVVTVFSLFVGALAAYALARFRFKGQRASIMFLIITQMFPLVLLCIPYFRVVVRLGLYDTLTALIVVGPHNYGNRHPRRVILGSHDVQSRAGEFSGGGVDAWMRGPLHQTAFWGTPIRS